MIRNEAIESLRRLYFDTNAENKAALECLIPELKESEDEKIRKQIEQAIIEHDWSATYKVSKDDCLAYLEKQEEQKPSTPEDIAAAYQMGLAEGRNEQKPVENISRLTVKGKGVYKICPRCKERMVRDDSKVYTSMPPQYGYTCPKCGTTEFDTVMYDSPEVEEQKPALRLVGDGLISDPNAHFELESEQEARRVERGR